MKIWKIVNLIQKSFWIPTKLRMRLLRAFGVKLHSTSIMAGGSFLGSNKLTLENNVFVNINCFFDGNAEIKLEDCVRVGPYVRILTCSHTINAGVLRRFGNSSQIIAPVTVKKGSWLGIGVTILPGVTIEEGCVIAANSLVIHSTTPNGLYGGTPAVRIKDLPF